MKYRNLGLLSISLAATAALIVYAGTTTNAQSPLGSTSSNSHAHDHDHDHQHDGHDHSHAPSSDRQPSDPVVVPAPSGGPPPLPSPPPSKPAPQVVAPQRQPAPNSEADSLPSLLPPRRDDDYGCRQGDYACPNVERYGADGHYGDSPLRNGRHACPFDRGPLAFGRPHCFVPNHGPLEVSAPCRYDQCRASRCCGLRLHDYDCHDSSDHGLTNYGH